MRAALTIRAIRAVRAACAVRGVRAVRAIRAIRAVHAKRDWLGWVGGVMSGWLDVWVVGWKLVAGVQGHRALGNQLENAIPKTVNFSNFLKASPHNA